MSNTLPIGTLLRGGTYKVLKPLSNGGFGNTYMVENLTFHETYAMKEFFMQGVTERKGNTVSVSQQDNAEVFNSQKEKFRKEAQRIRKLNHSGIVKIYDLFEENGTCYYIMDYIDGESLFDRLKRQGAMSESETLQVLDSLLDTLSVVHAAGLTHMDIKPGNIMLDRQGRIYLIDFGASKQMTTDVQRTLSFSAMPYSKGYAPMEQVEQDVSKIGPWTDFYALGATLYKLLTNLQPPSSNEILSNNKAFSFPADVSPYIRQQILWMMQPARDKRPQSVAEIQRLSSNRPSNQEKKEGKPNILMWVGVCLIAICSFGMLIWIINSSSADTSENKTIEIQEKVVYDDSLQVINANGITYKMIFVEGGTFKMLGKRDDITLADFYMGENEVTVGLWKAVMCYDPSRFHTAECPVEKVSWNDCKTFIKKLNALTGKNFRLPSEAEWEFAARGGNLSRHYKYSGSNSFEDVAWTTENSAGTQPVRRKLPNELGLYDMSGNVSEWCNDSIQTNDGVYAVTRGGNWHVNDGFSEISSITHRETDYWSSTLGFRLAL